MRVRTTGVEIDSLFYISLKFGGLEIRADYLPSTQRNNIGTIRIGRLQGSSASITFYDAPYTDYLELCKALELKPTTGTFHSGKFNYNPAHTPL